MSMLLGSMTMRKLFDTMYKDVIPKWKMNEKKVKKDVYKRSTALAVNG